MPIKAARQGRFNSRAHGARDCRPYLCGRQGTVSIHARTGRATRPAVHHQVQRPLVSIHARTGRATTRSSPFCASPSMFQFTRARGARRGMDSPPMGIAEFQFTRARGARRPPSGSTAPHRHTFQFTRARGARLYIMIPKTDPVSFNSRAHGARDPRSAQSGRSSGCFNSRAHGARDVRRTSAHRSLGCFNSRAHGARDRLVRQHAPDLLVSIHARTGRATFLFGFSSPIPRFQFTRARGARPSAFPYLFAKANAFQFTRARGARPAPAS